MNWLIGILYALYCVNTVFGQTLESLGKTQRLGKTVFKIKEGKIPKSPATLSAKDKAVTDKLYKLVENSRKYFGPGTDVIPPLDPYVEDDLKRIEIDASKLTLLIYLRRCKFNKLVVKGAQHFKMEKLAAHAEDLLLDAEYSVPSIIINVDFKLDGIIMGIIPYNVPGHARVELKNLRVSSSKKFHIVNADNDTHLKLVSLHVDAVADNVLIKIEGLEVLKIPTTSATNMIKHIIENTGKHLVSKINEVLEKVSGKYLLSLLK